MEPLKIIAAVFIKDDKVLILKRTRQRKSYPGKWNVISGNIEANESPKDCMRREIKEEIGISDFELIKEVKPYLDIQKEGEWLVYPFLCQVLKGDNILLDKKEHDRYKWVSIKKLDLYDLVPGVKKDLSELGLL